MTYARGTDTSPEKSRVEIEKLLVKMRATQHGVGFDNEKGEAIVQFTIEKKKVAFRVVMPKRETFKVARNGYYPSETKIDELWQQAIREKWRALLMVLKGKFVAVETGVETFEQAFFYHLQLPQGGTVGEHVAPAYREALMNPTQKTLTAGTR